MNPFFDWLKGTGTQAVELFITACAAIGALLLTWYFGRKSLTKKDLARVEGNTAHLEEVRTSIASVDTRLKKQEDIDQLRIRANRVSIAARGYQSGDVPLDLLLSVKKPQEPDFTLTHLELYNERDLPSGSFPCARMDNPHSHDYSASIPMMTIGNWFRSGTADEMSHRRRLKIRAWMSINGVEVSRDMGVIVIQTEPGSMYPAYDVQGCV
jgi:hypothetical protein